jgi:hypothetical protein
MVYWFLMCHSSLTSFLQQNDTPSDLTYYKLLYEDVLNHQTVLSDWREYDFPKLTAFLMWLQLLQISSTRTSPWDAKDTMFKVNYVQNADKMDDSVLENY